MSASHPRTDYTRLQVPGLPGVRFRDMPLELGGRSLRLYTASAVDVLGHAEPSTRTADGPYWCVAWPAGLALARLLAREDLRGARVLELGCGMGISAFGAVVGGASVLATDNVPQALRLTAMNARRNGLPLRVAAADWRHWPLRARFDLVIGSDVTYLPQSFKALAEVAEGALAPGGEVWLTDPFRTATAGFLEEVRGGGWKCTLSELREGPHTIRLMRLLPPR